MTQKSDLEMLRKPEFADEKHAQIWEGLVEEALELKRQRTEFLAKKKPFTDSVAQFECLSLTNRIIENIDQGLKLVEEHGNDQETVDCYREVLIMYEAVRDFCLAKIMQTEGTSH